MFLKKDEISIFYEKKGSGSPIILLHGNGESHEIFDEILDPLSEKHAVYAIDTRGHGKSSHVDSFSYEEMASDIIFFIEKLQIQRPLLYGFSDGGIVGLLVAYRKRDILSGLIISGANTRPKGLKISWYGLFKVMFLVSRDEKLRLMLTQPNITEEMLHEITIPVLVLAGERDMVRLSDTKFIAEHIGESRLCILKGETHASYVCHSKKILSFIQDFTDVQHGSRVP